MAEGTPAELKREISGDVLVVGLSPTTAPEATKLLDAEPYANRIGAVGDARPCAPYVDEGATRSRS